MRTTFLAFAVLAMIACGCTTRGDNAQRTTPSKQEYLEALDSAAVQTSLVYWTPDTVYSANPELLLLLDSLYQHEFTRTATTSEADVRADEAWVAAYRKKLCGYYDRRIARNDTISEFAKADSVLNEGLRLVNLDNHYSTLEMIVASDIKIRFNRCREYGLLSRLVSASNDTSKELIYKEFACYARMSSVAANIVSDIVSLCYWGGTIDGPTSMSCLLSMQEARMKSYRRMTDSVLGYGGYRGGVFPASAKKLYEDYVNTSLKRFSDWLPDFEPELYAEKRKETAESLRSILPLIDDWQRTVAQLNSALTTDGTRHYIEGNAARLLTAFAEQATWY